MEWSGPAIRPGLDIRHLIREGHRGLIEGDKRSRKVMEGLFPSLDPPPNVKMLHFFLRLP